MSKEIICVYQDCVMCGDHGKKLGEIATSNAIAIRKVSFASPEGKELSYIATFQKGIKRMPFFVDGDDFAEDLTALIAEKAPKPEKKARKSKKKGDAE